MNERAQLSIVIPHGLVAMISLFRYGVRRLCKCTCAFYDKGELHLIMEIIYVYDQV